MSGTGQEHNLGTDELSPAARSTKRDTLCDIQNDLTRLVWQGKTS
jgi:hypothetical protein